MKTSISLRFATVLILALGCNAAFAHFNLDIKIRTFHVVHTNSGMDVYVRMPTPYFLAELFIDSTDPERAIPAPFTYNESEGGVVLHNLDLDKVRTDPFGFAAIAARGLEFSVEGTPLKHEIIDVRVHEALLQPPFASVSEAKSALEGDVINYPYEEIYVGDTVTDLLLRFEIDRTIDTYSIQSTFNPDLPDVEDTANLIVDHYPGSAQIFRVVGLLHEPVEISNSWFDAALSFVVAGIVHILIGLDHVLFVVCLTIGAAHLINLLWRVTGFTIGHTITLIAGFWGFVPQGAWFVPAVELCIALSIIYVALIALRTSTPTIDRHASFIVTLAIGLLHGLGFSFVLHEILLPDGAHLWKSLVSFNIGVEIGQVAIVLVIWVFLMLIGRLKAQVKNLDLKYLAKWAVAVPCLLISSFWVVERIKPLLTVV